MNGERNPYGLKVVSKADHVYLQSYLLQEGRFPDAFATYCHELLHQYGGDSSSQFHRALVIMNRKIMENIDIFRAYKEKWEEANVRLIEM